jgi:fructose/tagatose bisphosphate aldolase
MGFKSGRDLLASLGGAIAVDKTGIVTVADPGKLAGGLIDLLAREAAVAEVQEVKDLAIWLIREAGLAMGVVPASINELYMARGRGEVSGFTVPAVNIRGMTYHTARALFKAAGKIKAGAFIFEIAKSEMGYTSQRPAEYVSQLVAAAIREGFAGPLFIQGDHFQANAKKFKENRGKEVGALKDLISEAIDAGFYNIDIDSSTLVDLARPTVFEQQRDNFEVAAELTAFIRGKTPAGITVSVGAEIGEVGKKNSTEEELHAFMKGYNETLAGLGSGLAGISKMSVQTGTSHGGVVLPDGSIAKVALDFSVLQELGKAGRAKFGMAGTVQHGASTLPEEAFDKFPEVETAEVHLATGFQNMLYDSAHFPADLRDRIFAWVRENCADEKKPADSEQQFLYKARKKGFGQFKKDIWEIPEAAKLQIMAELEAKFALIFGKLRIEGTDKKVKSIVHPVAVHKAPPAGPVNRQEIDKEGDD